MGQDTTRTDTRVNTLHDRRGSNPGPLAPTIRFVVIYSASTVILRLHVKHQNQGRGDRLRERYGDPDGNSDWGTSSRSHDLRARTEKARKRRGRKEILKIIRGRNIYYPMVSRSVIDRNDSEIQPFI
jgi:hypothetical protein